MKHLTDFLKSIISYFYAFRIIFSDRKILFLTIIPFILNIVLFAAVVYFWIVFGYPRIASFLEHWGNDMQTALSSSSVQSDAGLFLSGLLFILSLLLKVLLTLGKFLSVVIVFFLIYLSYPLLGSILMAPFLDPISYQAEKFYRGKNPEIKEMSFFRVVFRALFNAIKLVCFILFFNVFILFFNLIPGIGSFLYVFLNFLFVSFVVGFSFLDLCFERRGYSFRKKLKVSWKGFGFTVGLGMIFNIFVMIPVAGFLNFSVASVAAAVGFHRVFSGSVSDNG